jgi:hypothetical protein
MIPNNRSGYHVLLSGPQILPVQVINVPVGLGLIYVDPRVIKLGLVDFAWLADTLSSATVNLHLPPQSLPIHLMSAVVAVDLTGAWQPWAERWCGSESSLIRTRKSTFTRPWEKSCVCRPSSVRTIAPRRH